MVAEKRAKLAAARSKLAALQRQLADTQAELGSLTFQVRLKSQRQLFCLPVLEVVVHVVCKACSVIFCTCPRTHMTDASRTQADLSHRRLGRAGKLTALLGDEMARWGAQAGELAQRLALLPGDALLAAACITYTGAFTGVCAWMQV